MDCLTCRDMERVVKSRHAEYVEARLAAYYRVCTKLAARSMVDLERAKNELQEHQQVCASTAREPAHLPEQELLSFP